jgi:hypothetical protein
MTVHSASRARYPLGSVVSRPRPQTPLAAWARERLTGRVRRRVEGVARRAATRLGQHLGPAWRVVHPPDPDPGAVGDDHAGFVAIGPSGVFAVSVVDHGRQRVMIAGDVIQIQGRRPPYVARARRYARRIRNALTDAVGTNVPVVAVLTFAGSGAISAHGLPTGCLAVSLRELGVVLRAAKQRIAPETARKLAEVAAHPLTWRNRGGTRHDTAR